jgi:hypothetical protein
MENQWIGGTVGQLLIRRRRRVRLSTDIHGRSTCERKRWICIFLCEKPREPSGRIAQRSRARCVASCADGTMKVAGANQQRAESKRTRWKEVQSPSGPRGWTGHGGCVARRAWVASNVERDADCQRDGTLRVYMRSLSVAPERRPSRTGG